MFVLVLSDLSAAQVLSSFFDSFFSLSDFFGLQTFSVVWRSKHVRRTIGLLCSSQLPSGQRRAAACGADLHREAEPLVSLPAIGL